MSDSNNSGKYTVSRNWLGDEFLEGVKGTVEVTVTWENATAKQEFEMTWCAGMVADHVRFLANELVNDQISEDPPPIEPKLEGPQSN